MSLFPMILICWGSVTLKFTSLYGQEHLDDLGRQSSRLTFVVQNFPHNLLSPYDKYIILHIYLLRYLNKQNKSKKKKIITLKAEMRLTKNRRIFYFLFLKECSFKT